MSSLISDSSGDLFGVTNGGGSTGYGTVFELKAGASSVTTLATFSASLGGDPFGTLVADSSGNLFGTTNNAGPGNGGTVFELVKTGSNFALTTLASFSGANGNNPYAGLTIDASGNLFGTTPYGGANGLGTVFELFKGTAGYTLSTLASFNSATGNTPYGGLLLDAKGNLFGTTYSGGANNVGTVYELSAGSSTVSTLVAFDTTNGSMPYDALVADGSGNLFGTTSAGGVGGYGTVFEVSGTDFASSVPEPSSIALLAGFTAVTRVWRRRVG